LTASNLASINFSLGGAPASLAGFVGDEATRAALLSALGPDAGGAAVDLGGIDEAVAHLTNDPGATTVVVDLSGCPDVFKAIDRLAEVCTPGTAVIVLGEVNDVMLYRRLRAAGISDYLVKPVTSEAFAHALQAASQPHGPVGQEKTAKPTGEVIAVVGARGGIGTTTVATTLAWLLADESERRTTMIDLDLRWGTTGLAFDVECGHGLCEVLANPDRIDSLFVSSASARVDERLSLLASEEPLDNIIEARPGALELLLKEARKESERVVLDVPRSSSDLLRRAISQATIVVVVTDFSLAGLRDAGRLASLAKEAAPEAKRLVVGNRAGANKKGELSRPEVEKALGLKLTAVIPEERGAVLQAHNTGKPLSKVAPNSKVVASIRELIGSFDQTPVKKAGFLGRVFARGSKEQEKGGKKAASTRR